MDTRQLEYLVAVADERSFTRAAERVFAAQSTVSAGIQSLERELGAALFERDAHGVRPTEVGEAVLAEARAALEAVERMRDLAGDQGPLRGTVRVGIFTNLQSVDLPGIMGEFHRRHPDVDLRLGPSPGGSTGLVEDVRQGRLDIAFHGLPETVPDLLTRHLVDSPFLAVLPEGHPLARRRSVALADLAEEAWVDSRAGFGNRVTLDRAFAALGLTRRVPTELADLGEIPRFVAAGLGVAALPELTIIPAEGAVTRPLREPVDWRLNAIARPRPGRAAEALLTLLAERIHGA
ncbi:MULTISPECIES: LysR family transcriptional regulator [unclassified Leifsonia]|uniref:LysR family transcriptional regulator n=1 Tax=unclassified Leifsonia TaxID=2663824 RepID=UPI000360B13E|nr:MULTISPECIES: LysR family transcriptional regulator [unclassified Leifsonia]TDP98569.1 DNA-binding transcriptional LysR family regulator [Leifsonia sp. 115AMFTsu3.1]